MSPPPRLTKAQHLAAIEQIETEERRLREEIANKTAERSTLQAVLGSLPKKEDAAAQKRP